tara:strand:+ start:21 stop:209 length:189 start_codon:yes stop_codon:yes gene_type:complete
MTAVKLTRSQVIKSIMWRAVNIERADSDDLILEALERHRDDDEYLMCALDMAVVTEHINEIR